MFSTYVEMIPDVVIDKMTIPRVLHVCGDDPDIPNGADYYF